MVGYLLIADSTSKLFGSLQRCHQQPHLPLHPMILHQHLLNETGKSSNYESEMLTKVLNLLDRKIPKVNFIRMSTTLLFYL